MIGSRPQARTCRLSFVLPRSSRVILRERFSMLVRVSVGAALCLATIAAAADAQQSRSAAGVGGERAAQLSRVVRLLPGAQLGGVLPTGGLGDVYNTGIRAGLTLTAIVPTRPYGIRAALTYDRLPGGTIAPEPNTLVDVDAGSMLSVTVSGLVTEQAPRNTLLYFTAGAGVHRLDTRTLESLVPDDGPVDDPDNPPPEPGPETKFGASVGGGLTFQIGTLPSYLEVNVVKIFGADAVLVPVVLGVQLGR